jgi:hypothetical protein
MGVQTIDQNVFLRGTGKDQSTRDNIPVMLPDTHNHPNQEIKLKLDSTLQSRKKRYKEDTTPISTIYHQEVNKLPENTSLETKYFVSRLVFFSQIPLPNMIYLINI